MLQNKAIKLPADLFRQKFVARIRRTHGTPSSSRLLLTKNLSPVSKVTFGGSHERYFCLCRGRCPHRPLIEWTLSEFHTSNIQWAQMKRLARCVVRSGNPILRPARRAFGLRTEQRQNAERNDTPFQARKRYKNVPEPFSSISFPARGKRYGPRSGGCGFANRTAPPAHSKHAAGGIPRHSGAHEITPLPVRKMAHRRPCRIQTPSK